MTDQQIQRLLDAKAFPDGVEEACLVETHISWVILTPRFAFKIKKPLNYAFLDFSTLEKRKFYCERELVLNRRLTQGMYLDVVPIRVAEEHIIIAGERGKIIDYALKMRRMDESRQMNLLLEKGEVTLTHIGQLAHKLAAFHRQTEVVITEPDLAAMQVDFADILQVKDFLAKHWGKPASEAVEEAVAFSKHFLKQNERRILERHSEGFTLDGHGDLHSKNIFLPLAGEPVVFDCIEFSDHLRRVDVLNELAFLCMDLDFYCREDLASYFLQHYLTEYPCLFNDEDHRLLDYYKLYRANVRLKVSALKARSATEGKGLEKQLSQVKDYLELLRRYLKALSVLDAQRNISLFSDKSHGKS